jgi:hypothetical protein
MVPGAQLGAVTDSLDDILAIATEKVPRSRSISSWSATP